jgi:hypothetical protein
MERCFFQKLLDRYFLVILNTFVLFYEIEFWVILSLLTYSYTMVILILKRVRERTVTVPVRFPFFRSKALLCSDLNAHRRTMSVFGRL